MISVVIPVYNIEKYLCSCVDSVLGQTDTELEVLLVDDGSEDAGGRICDGYAARDSRVRVLHQENRGLSAARNRGIAEAAGEYIMLVDSDDYIEPDMCRKLLEALEESGADVAVCGCVEFREKTGEERRVPVTEQRRQVSGGDMLELLNGPDMKYYVTAWNRLYRGTLLKQIVFPEGRINEDLAVAHEVYHKAGGAVLLPETLYHYRLRGDGITGAGLTLRNLDAVEAVYRRYCYCLENHLEQFLPGTVQWGRRLWEIRRYVKPENARERRRLREIDGMFRRMYFSGYGRKSLKNTLAALCPGLYFRLKGRTGGTAKFPVEK